MAYRHQPLVSWGVALVVGGMLMGCAEVEPAPSCGEAADYGLDVELRGLHADTRYEVWVEAEGRSLVVTSDPLIPNLFVETAIDPHRSLVASLYDGVLRVVVLSLDGDSYGPDEVTVTVTSRGAEVGSATFVPDYLTEVPEGDDDCTAFVATTDELRLSAPPE